MKNSIRLIAAISICALTVSLMGCGNNEELDKYYDEMSTFSTNVSGIKQSMDELDTTDPNSVTELLGYLDAMETEFEVLSNMNVPKQFSGNETLADEAYEYMTQAVALFHEYYDDSESDYSTFETASENYSRAMKRIEYISTLLKGEVPEGDGVNVEEQDYDFTPVTDESIE